MTAPLLLAAVVATSTASADCTERARAWQLAAIEWERGAMTCAADLDQREAEHGAALAACRGELAARGLAPLPEAPSVIPALLSGAALGGAASLGLAAGLACESEGCRIGAAGLAIGLAIVGLAGLLF